MNCMINMQACVELEKHRIERICEWSWWIKRNWSGSVGIQRLDQKMERAACWEACRQKTPENLSNRSVLGTCPRKSVAGKTLILFVKDVGKCGSNATRLRQTGLYALRELGKFCIVSPVLLPSSFSILAQPQYAPSFPRGGSPIC